jgi:hypothetical protein
MNTNDEVTDNSTKGFESDFEDARLRFCIAAFERQRSTVQDLEKKSQLLLSFSTAILATLFLKFEYLKLITIVLSTTTMPFYFILVGWISLAILGISCFLSLIFLLQSIRLRRFSDAHPDNMVDSLFSKDSELGSITNTSNLLKHIAIYYAVAIDDNKVTIQKKSKSLKLVQITTLVSLMTLLVLMCIIIVIYFTVKKGSFHDYREEDYCRRPRGAA